MHQFHIAFSLSVLTVWCHVSDVLVVLGVHLLRQLRPHYRAESESIPEGLDRLAQRLRLGEEASIYCCHVVCPHKQFWQMLNTKYQVLSCSFVRY